MSTRIIDDDGMIHMGYYEIQGLFSQYNRMVNWQDSRNNIRAHVVFSNDTPSWRRHDFTLEARTYRFWNCEKAFIDGMGGYSIFAGSLDGSDYTRIEHVDWIVEDAYMEPEYYDRMMAVLEGRSTGRAGRTQPASHLI